MWAFLKIVIMCVDSAIEPSICLDSVPLSVPKTELLLQPPALLVATPYAQTSARVQSSG